MTRAHMTTFTAQGAVADILSARDAMEIFAHLSRAEQKLQPAANPLP